MASSILKVETGGYQLRWRDPEGRQRKKMFARKVDAEDYKTNIDHSMRAGAYVDPLLGKQTFKDYAEAWRAVRTHRGGTAKQIESHLRLHVYPVLGQRPIGAIRPSEIDALVYGLSTTLAPATVEVIYTWTSTILKAAVRDRVIGSSPCEGIALPEKDHKRIVPISADQVRGIIETIDPRYRGVVVLGAGSGVRISEALGVTVDRLAPMMRSVTIDRQLSRDQHREDGLPEFGKVKDRKNRPRVIPVPEFVGLELSAHLARYGEGPGGLVFTAKTRPARWLRVSTFAEAFRKAADPLGVEGGFHELRHFYASALIAHGESVKVVQDRLGHSSATMTLDVYGHLWPNAEDSTRAAIEAAFAPAPADERPAESARPL